VKKPDPESASVGVAEVTPAPERHLYIISQGPDEDGLVLYRPGSYRAAEKLVPAAKRCFFPVFLLPFQKCPRKCHVSR
jgi:hypothetical protein